MVGVPGCTPVAIICCQINCDTLVTMPETRQIQPVITVHECDSLIYQFAQNQTCTATRTNPRKSQQVGSFPRSVSQGLLQSSVCVHDKRGLYRRLHDVSGGGGGPGVNPRAGRLHLRVAGRSRRHRVARNQSLRRRHHRRRDAVR